MGVLHVTPRDTNSPIRWEQGTLRNPSRGSRGNVYIGTLMILVGIAGLNNDRAKLLRSYASDLLYSTGPRKATDAACEQSDLEMGDEQGW